MYKQCQVVMLPTNQNAQLCLWKNKNLYTADMAKATHFNQVENSDCQNQHLYIASEDKIEIGDNVLATINERSRVLKCNTKIFEANCRTSPTLFKKIVATTDSELYLPSPSNEFLQSYCENQPKEVFVEYEPEVLYKGYGSTPTGFKDKLVITNNQISIKKIKQSYTREEVINIFDKIKANDNIRLHGVKLKSFL